MEGEIRNIRTILDDVPRVEYLLDGKEGTEAYIDAMLRLTIVEYLDAMRPYMMRLERGADPRGYIRHILREYTTSKLPYPYGPVTREQLILLFCQYMVTDGDDVTIKRNLNLVIAAANFIGYEDGLIIQRSQIPGAGMGLWTTQRIPRKAPITLYGGIVQDKQTEVLEEAYIAKAEYNKKFWYVDAVTFFRLGEKGRWINDSAAYGKRFPGLENNARLYQVAPSAPKNKDPIKRPGVKMTKTVTRNVYSDNHIPVDIYVACKKTKAIEAGEEIFLTYGETYWGAGATQYDEEVSESTQESETTQKVKQQDDKDEDSEFIYSTEVSQQEEEEDEDIPSTEEDEENGNGKSGYQTAGEGEEEEESDGILSLSMEKACIQCRASPWQYLAGNNFLHRFCSHDCARTFYLNQ